MEERKTRLQAHPGDSTSTSGDVALHTETLLSLEKDDKPSGGDPETQRA